jgi:hypothetical protein
MTRIRGLVCAVIVLCAAGVACGGNPASPGREVSLIAFVQYSTDAMSVSLNVDGQPLSAPGQHQLQLSVGTHTVTGTLTGSGQTGQTLVIFFQQSAGEAGGVRTGSVRNATGPVLQSGTCAVAYTTGSVPTTTAQNFSFQFDVTSEANRSCQGAS